MQQEQNYSNHGRMVPMYHYVAFALLLAILIGAVISLTTSTHEKGNLYVASLILAMALLIGIALWYTRVFALKAQDRAIRAEERLRYFMLTGRAMPADLRMGQIIALRFASDEEFVALCDRALKEKLDGKTIKQAIQHWKADHNRV
jgi:uncharacterized membrane protein